MSLPKPLHTEFCINLRLESCVWLYFVMNENEKYFISIFFWWVSSIVLQWIKVQSQTSLCVIDWVMVIFNIRHQTAINWLQFTPNLEKMCWLLHSWEKLFRFPPPPSIPLMRQETSCISLKFFHTSDFLWSHHLVLSHFLWG